MKPDMLMNSACDATNANEDAAFTKIHVLEPGKDQWDVIRDVANSGVQEEAFFVLDVGDIVRKHKEWKLKLPRVTPFYGKQNVQITLVDQLLNFGFSASREVQRSSHCVGDAGRARSIVRLRIQGKVHRLKAKTRHI